MYYRSEIDGLRALAVLPVVLFHAGVAGFGGGFIGVDVFFVISGFLITSIILKDLQNGQFSMLNFWERRARRILPALVVVVIFSMVAGWFLFLPGDFDLLGKTALAQSFFASNHIFWRELGYFGATAGEVPLLHTWSLAVEEQFYLIFPATIFIITRYIVRLRWSIVALGVIFSFALSVWSVGSRPEAAFYLLPMRAWELGIGALIAFWAIKRPGPINSKIAEPASVLGIALILFAVFAYDDTTAFPGIAALPPVIGTALVIWSNTTRRTRSGDLLALKPLVGIGLISYSLYLWHWPLIVFWTYPQGSESLSGPVVALLVGISFIVAYASWRYIETPFRRRRVLPGRRAMLSGSFATLMLVGGAGLFMQVDPGSDLRLPDGAEPYVQAENSRSQRQIDCVANNLTADEIGQDGAICVYGELDSAPQFVAWGDSHVDSLMPALDMLAADHGVTGLHISRSNCPPILDVSNRSTKCAPHNSAVRDLMFERGIKVAVLSASWVGYQWDPNRLTPVPGSTFVPSSDAPATIISDGITSTTKSLMEAGIEVWLVRDVPRFDFDPPRKLFGALRFDSEVEDVGQDYEAYMTYMAPFDAVFATLESEGARIIDLPNLLCDSTFCSVMRGTTVLYRDNHHLSVAGSEYIAPALSPVFLELLDSQEPARLTGHAEKPDPAP